MHLKKLLGILFMSSILSACGGDSDDSNYSTPTAPPSSPIATKIVPSADGKITISGQAQADSTITVNLPDGTQKTTKVDSEGKYTLTINSPSAGGEIKITSTNSGGDTSKPTTLDADTVTKTIYQSTGKMPDLAFSPSLGINTEAPQGGVDTVGQAMPFVDVFRTARPFSELSFVGTEFDEDGWVTKLPEDDLDTENIKETYTRTKLMQGTLSGAVPNGKYTLLYEGEGKLELGGKAISNVKGLSSNDNTRSFTFDYVLKDSDNPETNSLSVVIRETLANNYIKDIRIVMPGGTCRNNADDLYNPFIRVNSQSECPENTTYVSFADRLKENRNEIIFNPDYLMFLRNFKVVRMMNLMEASHATHNCMNGTVLDEACMQKETTWDKRAKMDHAVWGGNDGRTQHHDRNGVPVEVVIKLANILKRDIWLNMPHAATDDYITEIAQSFYAGLDSNIKIYLEYSNEVWNNGFLGHHYAEKKGFDAGMDKDIPDISSNRDEEYFARLRYYSYRSVKIFKLWEAEFASTDRFIRVLGTSQGDTVLSDQMIKYINKSYDGKQVDAIAMAPYFFGCIENKGSCEDAPKTLLTATTTDDVFDILNQPYKENGNVIDPSALDATIEKIKLQAKVATAHNLHLLTYEGGQHYTIMGAMGKESEKEKARLRTLFKKVNRDPRMKDAYLKLLNAWKEVDGTTLFTLYTLPQSYYRFGNFGIKEHLNKSRAESPKFDGAMTFQEAVKKCWWDGCNP